MQVKFLKSIIEGLINRPSAPIVDLLVGKKDVNEFLIAKKLGLTINQTRNILYKLSDYGLVSFIRKKDKRKGWYIYFWTLNIHQALVLLEKKLLEELNQLEIQLKNRKQKRHYFCNTCSIEVTEEVALLNDFTCQECEEIYELSDVQEIINQLEKRISKIKKELELVSVERQKEGERLEKKKALKIKKAELQKKEKRRESREIRRKEKIKEQKKLDRGKLKKSVKQKNVKKSANKKKKIKSKVKTKKIQKNKKPKKVEKKKRISKFLKKIKKKKKKK